jgi:hypothetical protein
MAAHRHYKKCNARTVREIHDRLNELKNEMRNWMAQSGPPGAFSEEWFAGMCGEPSQFTRQLVNLRDALQEAGLVPAAENEVVRVQKG